MANFPVKPNGGSGGKLGHSNMTHWGHTEEIKESAKKARRVCDRKTIDEFFEDFYSGLSDEQIKEEQNQSKTL